jgi:hypothetical protein
MAERKSGPVKPPVIDLKARDASQPSETDKPTAKPAAAPKPAAAKVEPKSEAVPEAAKVAETVTERVIETPTEAKPEPVRPIPTPPSPPTPPVRQARLAMPWSAIGIAAVGGAILGTILTYLLVNLLPMPSSAPVIADPAEQLTALDSRTATLEQRVPTLEESAMGTQVSLDATITQLDSGLAEVKSSIATLETRLAQVQAAIPAAATPVDLAPLTTQLDTLEARVTAIGAGASSADADALADSLNGIETSLAALTARLDQSDARLGEIDAIRTELNTAKAAIAAQTQQLGGADIGPAVKLPLVVSGLETAFAAGRAYTAELDSLRALLPNLAVPEAVATAATTGLQRPDAIAVDFRTAVPVILAGRTAQSTGDWGKDAIEWAKALLALRPAGEMEGNSPEAIVSRLEAAVERHDFVAAAALLDLLPAPMQAAAGEVAGAIRTHASADGFIAGLRAQALAPATEAAP